MHEFQYKLRYIARRTEAGFKQLKNRQIEVDASKIQLNSVASIVAENLYQTIIDFQNTVSNEEDVVLSLVQFGQTNTIFVKEIGYIGYNLVYFLGSDTDGNMTKLIQHVQQLNFLLKAVPKRNPDTQKRKIGFVR